MANNQVTYIQQEIDEACESLTTSLNYLDDIESSLSGDFDFLGDLFSDGLSKMKKQASRLSTFYTSLISKLEKHSADLRALEQMQTQYVVSTSSGGGSNVDSNSYSGEEKKIEEIITGAIAKGLSVKAEDDTKEVELDDYKSSKESVISKLKELKGKESTVVQVDDNLEVMPVVLEPIKKEPIGDDDRIIDIGGDIGGEIILPVEPKPLPVIMSEKDLQLIIPDGSTLIEIPYLQKVARDNGLETNELFLQENSKILLDALHDIYEGEVSDLTITDLSKIKEYTDSLTSENNTTLYELFSNLTVEGE